MAADLAALLDHLKIKKAVIAGHSMGGYMALAFARAYPERLLGLGLVASQALADTPEKKAGRIPGSGTCPCKWSWGCGRRDVHQADGQILICKPD